ncbi:hypothetical protein AA0311_2605 [Asaia bogorensis NBRC 16594]|uniref:Uncharacterized protein n=1 Tax=Asaia bogorensis NBRC 16594 TaxID=1231624 RepID=A0AAN4U3T2_9PROT|nr:hypothetical protein AA0311_2605 [Asaia bogorensis NBRC 16594]GEL54883.1 hypothetical protein ABO01nite_28900 [Asaia bogorensis NBRC 16594]
MNKDNANTAASNAVTLQGKVRWNSLEELGPSGHFCDPVSGWRSDDPCHAVHEALASTTFRILHDTFAAGTHLPTSPSDDTQQA